MVLKSIVAFLVLANIGYFLWSHGIARAQPVTAAAPPAGTLRLASEAPAPRPITAAGISAAGATPDTAGDTSAAKHCMTVGPFKDVSEAAHAASTLRGIGYDPRQRVVEGDVWAGVWVYLPIPSPRPAGDQTFAKLKSAGIDDALEMPGPAEGSVISLGLFSEPKRAQARVAQVQALGLNPAVVDRKRTGNVYWIDTDLNATDSAPNAADLQGDAGHINRLEVKACPAAPQS
jgi:hypothetical protein